MALNIKTLKTASRTKPQKSPIKFIFFKRQMRRHWRLNGNFSEPSQFFPRATIFFLVDGRARADLPASAFIVGDFNASFAKTSHSGLRHWSAETHFQSGKMANTETEFAEYLSMESFFNAETLSQQNFHVQAQHHNQDYGNFAPLETSAYTYEAAMDHSQHSQHPAHHPNQEKFDFHNNNNNNVQYFYENNNPVQVAQSPAVGGHPSEFYVSLSKI